MPISYDPDTQMYKMTIREVCGIIEKTPMHKRHKGAQHAFTILKLDPDRIMNVTGELYNTWLANMKISDQIAEWKERVKLKGHMLQSMGIHVQDPVMQYIPQTNIDEEVENDEELDNLVGGMVRDSDFMIEVDHISKEEFRELEHQSIMDEWSRLQNEEVHGTN